jgi:V8-like Glu-specific endopeptidase
MPNLLDAVLFPWFHPLAGLLHQTLTQLHPTGKAAGLLADQAGLDTTQVNLDQPPFYVWSDLLNLAARQGLTRALVQQVQNRLSPSSPHRGFLADLLANRSSAADAEIQLGVGGAPLPEFLGGVDEVSDPEALLYRDDLTMPIGKLPGLIATLQRLTNAARGVCKLTVEFPGVTKYGTAFRVGLDWVVTNWHVLHNKSTGKAARAVSAEFGYDDDGRDGLVPAVPVRFDPATIVTDQADDWAVIRAAEPMREEWSVLALSGATIPVVGGAAYIVQHPAGGRKRVGFVRNQVSDFDDRVVHYLTDTQEGSSGAPVFDEEGRLIAIHHAAGRPQEVLGKPPVKKNEGIRIPRVLTGLRMLGVALP